jgi:mannan endo-1,4-beta-mannosidase
MSTHVPTAGPTVAPTAAPMYFITRSESKLYDRSTEFRFVSVNKPNYFILEDRAWNFTDGWHRVTEFEKRNACRTAELMGGRLLRTYTLSIQGGANVRNNLARNTGSNGNLTYNEELFEDKDHGIAIAREEGLWMYIPLIDNLQCSADKPNSRRSAEAETSGRVRRSR